MLSPLQTKKKEACADDEKPALALKAHAEFILIDIAELILN